MFTIFRMCVVFKFFLFVSPCILRVTLSGRVRTMYPVIVGLCVLVNSSLLTMTISKTWLVVGTPPSSTTVIVIDDEEDDDEDDEDEDDLSTVLCLPMVSIMVPSSSDVFVSISLSDLLGVVFLGVTGSSFTPVSSSSFFFGVLFLTICGRERMSWK